jgi:hypothetical protein
MAEIENVSGEKSLCGGKKKLTEATTIPVRNASSPTWDPAQLACLGCVFALRLALASDDVTRFSLRLRQ